MPARDLRDQGMAPPLPPQDSLTQQPGSLLIVPPAPLQRVAVELVLSDFEAAKKERDSR